MASIKKNTFYVVASRIVSTLLGFIASIFLVRLLGAEGNGVFSKVNAAGTLLITLTLFNVYPGITYFTANKKIAIDKLFAMALLFIFGSLCLSGLIFAVLYITDYQSLLLPQNHQSKFFVIYLGIFIILNVFSGILKAFLRGKTQFRELYYSNIISAILKVILFAGAFYYSSLFLLQSNIITGLGLFLTILTISTIIVAWFFRKHFPQIKPNFTFNSKEEFKTFYVYNLLAYFAVMANFLTKKIDIWFIEHYNGLHELGIYALAAALSQLVLNLTATLRTVLFPYLAKAEKQESIGLLKIFSRINFSSVFMIMILGILIAPTIIPLLYGIDFQRSILIFQILLFSICFICFRNIFTIYNTAKDKSYYNIWSNTSTLFIIIILDLILIPKYGIIGAAWASCIAYFIGMLITMFTVFKLQKIPFGNYFFLTKEDFKKAIAILKQYKKKK